MKNLNKIGRALRQYYGASTHYVQIDDLPPAPPWVEREFKNGKWSEWTFDPYFVPTISSLTAGTFLIPPAIIFFSGGWGVVLTILAVAITVAWPIWTAVNIKRNTHMYMSLNSKGTRYIVEATILGKNDDVRARVIAKDSPVRIDL